MDSREERQLARDTLREIELLLSLPVWGKLVGVIQAQVDALQSQILNSPINSLGDVATIERAKGALEGRLSLTRTIETWQEEMNYIVNRKVSDV